MTNRFQLNDDILQDVDEICMQNEEFSTNVPVYIV